MQHLAMFDYLDDIHLQALEDSKDLFLRVDLCMNWEVSAVLIPELHSSHFMGSIIPLMMRLSLIKQMIEVRTVNWGGYYPGGRRSLSAVAAVEDGGLAVGDEREDCVQSKEDKCNIVMTINNNK